MDDLTLVGEVVGEATYSGVSSNPTITNCVSWNVALPYGTKIYVVTTPQKTTPPDWL